MRNRKKFLKSFSEPGSMFKNILFKRNGLGWLKCMLPHNKRLYSLMWWNIYFYKPRKHSKWEVHTEHIKKISLQVNKQRQDGKIKPLAITQTDCMVGNNLHKVALCHDYQIHVVRLPKSLPGFLRACIEQIKL